MDRDDLSDAADALEAASNAKPLDIAARFGFAVMALLHIIVGGIAFALAFNQPGEAEATGAIEQLADQPWGLASMLAGFVGCLALSIWQLSEATLRARHLPRKERLAKLTSSGFLGLAYGSVGVTFGSFAIGIRGDSGDSTRDLSTAIMRSAFGGPILVAIGLLILGIGGYFIVKGIRKGFQEELSRFNGRRRGSLIDWLGVVGHIAKGIALGLVGILFIVAAAKNEPAESTGLDGSLKALRDHPMGPYLLAAIGAGFICYGVFALIRSRYGRM